MNSESMNNQSYYIGKVVSLDLANWIVTFTCPQLTEDEEKEELLTAIPLFNHTCELVKNDQILIIKPNEVFSDCLFYLPITIREFIGLKVKESFIDMTNPDRIYITTPKVIELKVGNGHLTVTNNSVVVQGNMDVVGNLSQVGAYSGTIVDKTGVSHLVKNGIIVY